MIDPRKHFVVSCKSCDYVWSLTVLPIPLGQMAKIASRSCCPKCDSTSEQHLVANEEMALAWAMRQEAIGG